MCDGAERRIRPQTITLVAAGLFLLLSEATNAEPPKIERVFPPGGQRGTTVEVALTGKPGKGKLNVWSERHQLKFEFTDKNDAAQVTVPDEAIPGVHWLRLHNQHGATSLLPFFVGTLPEVVEAEPNDEPDTATKIEQPSVTVNGVLEKAHEVDVFALSLKPGDTLVAAMEANQRLASPMDAVLQVLDGNGTVVAHNDDDFGFDPLVVFTAETAGEYFVRTFAFPATPNSTIRLAGAKNYVYRLMLTTGPYVHHTSPLSVQTGESRSVSLRGWNLPDMAEAVVDDADLFRTAGALPRPVSIVRHRVTTAADVADKTVTLPISISGVLSEAKTADEFRFDGKKGQSIMVSAAARRIGSLLDPVVTVTSADGKVVKEIDDASREDLDAAGTVKLRVDGEHIIRVADRFESGSDRHFYELTLSEAVPLFVLKVKQSEFIVTKEESLEIEVDVVRENGFSEPIQIRCEGLPDGAESSAVTSEAKGDSSKKVKLTIKRASGDPWSGLITVVGLSGDHKITAAAEVGTSGYSTQALWLTLPPED